jgi:hypothetical protein
MFSHTKERVVRVQNKMFNPQVMCEGDIKRLSNATSN